jgi:signal transduction histidine kinase
LGEVKQLGVQEKAGGEFPPAFAGLKDEERHRAAEAVREGSKLYVIEAVFDVTDFDRRFRELRDQLGKNSEIISTSAQMDRAKIYFRVLYASSSEKIPVSTIFQQALRAGKSSGKEIEFVVQGRELVFEKPFGDAIGDAVLHLVRNAVDHGIESSGKIILDAAETYITVTDDGRGIDPANLPHIFQPGFSTAKEVTESSGRGVGLDVVATTIKELGGNVTVTSKPGKGSSFKINLPNQWSEIKKSTPSSDA